MKTYHRIILLCVISLLLFTFCENRLFNLIFSDTGNGGSTGADFSIVDVQYGMKTYGSPYIMITVENVGNKTAYNVSCDVIAKRNGIEEDSGFAYFADGGDIEPG